MIYDVTDPAQKHLFPCRVFDADNKELTYEIVRFDSETGRLEVYEKPKRVIDGVRLATLSVLHNPPLRIEPLNKIPSPFPAVSTTITKQAAVELLDSSEVLRIDPGDIVVMRFTNHVSQEVADAAKERLLCLGIENPLIILENGAELGVLRVKAPEVPLAIAAPPPQLQPVEKAELEMFRRWERELALRPKEPSAPPDHVMRRALALQKAI